MTKTYRNIDIENFPAFIKMEDARYAVKAAKKDADKARAEKALLEEKLNNVTDKVTAKNLKVQIANKRAVIKECNEAIKTFKEEQARWSVEVDKIKAKYGIA